MSGPQAPGSRRATTSGQRHQSTWTAAAASGARKSPSPPSILFGGVQPTKAMFQYDHFFADITCSSVRETRKGLGLRALFACLIAELCCRFTFNDNANLTNSTYINLKEREGCVSSEANFCNMKSFPCCNFHPPTLCSHQSTAENKYIKESLHVTQDLSAKHSILPSCL